MLGNLSKILIKAPSFFNNMNTETQDNSQLFYEIPEKENLLSPFNGIKIVQRGNSCNNLYFREKDFWKKNIMLDINYNHNKRYHPLISNPNYLNQLKENYTSKKKKWNSVTKSLILNNKKCLPFTPKTTLGNSNLYKKDNNYNLAKESDNDMTNTLKTLKTEIDNEIFKKNDTNFLQFHRRNNSNIRYEDENLENNKNNNEINTIAKEKFPRLYSSFRSQESLFQDNNDKRLNALRNISPQVKEQLKCKNRYMVGQREFLAYKKLNRLELNNPFYESIKLKEEKYKRKICDGKLLNSEI